MSPPPHPAPGHLGRAGGLENCDTDAEAGGSTAWVCDPWSQRKEPRECNRVFTHTTFLRERSCGPRAGLQPSGGGRDGCQEPGSPWSRLRDPRAGRPRSARPSARPEDPAAPAPARGPERATHPAPSGERTARAPARGPLAARPAGLLTKPARPPARRGRKSARGPARGASGAALGAQRPAGLSVVRASGRPRAAGSPAGSRAGGRAGRHLPRPRSLERRLPAKCEWLTGVVSPGSCKCWR